MIALSNAFVPLISPVGLAITVGQGTVYLSGTNTTVFSPFTTVGLAPNTTNFVFFNFATGLVAVNTSGFPNPSYPIATVKTTNNTVTTLTDNRPDYLA